jgi:hypothetical protein
MRRLYPGRGSLGMPRVPLWRSFIGVIVPGKAAEACSGPSQSYPSIHLLRLARVILRPFADETWSVVGIEGNTCRLCLLGRSAFLISRRIGVLPEGREKVARKWYLERITYEGCSRPARQPACLFGRLTRTRAVACWARRLDSFGQLQSPLLAVSGPPAAA